MTGAEIDAWEDELDQLRTPRDYYGRTFLGTTIGPYIQGQPEHGYGGKVLYRIRELRILISNYEGNKETNSTM